VKSAPWDPSYGLRLAKAQLAAGQNAAPAQGALASIAAGSNVAYDLRVKAALALAGRSHSDLGSGELNLLAGSPAAIPAAAADRFYFYEARIRAAQNTADVQMKTSLLSHCVIDFPSRDEARVALFQAAASAHSDEFAAGILEPLRQAQLLGSHVSSAQTEEEEIAGAESDEEDQGNESAAPAATTLKLSRTQQAQLAQMIGDVMTRLHRLSDAVSSYDIARRAETSPAVRQEIKRKIADARAALRIQQQNAARQPLLHEALEQDRVVRPRLLARAAPAPKAASAQGGVKQ